MAIVGGLDIHRRQTTDDILDTETGESCRGRLSPATRVELRAWLARFTGQPADVALGASTGWRFVAEELDRRPTAETPTRWAMEKIVPFLWFDDQAEEAANFYVSVFSKRPGAGTSSNSRAMASPP